MDIVLGRVGHYHVPSGDGAGSCQVAIVAFVRPAGSDGAIRVDLAAFQHDGEPFRRVDVPVLVPESAGDPASFHLTRDCPWGR